MPRLRKAPKVRQSACYTQPYGNIVPCGQWLSIRLFAIKKFASIISIPTKERFKFLQAIPVVPLPIKGSKTIPDVPSSVLVSSCLSNSTGLQVGWLKFCDPLGRLTLMIDLGLPLANFLRPLLAYQIISCCGANDPVKSPIPWCCLSQITWDLTV